MVYAVQALKAPEDTTQYAMQFCHCFTWPTMQLHLKRLNSSPAIQVSAPPIFTLNPLFRADGRHWMLEFALPMHVEQVSIAVLRCMLESGLITRITQGKWSRLVCNMYF